MSLLKHIRFAQYHAESVSFESLLSFNVFKKRQTLLVAVSQYSTVSNDVEVDDNESLRNVSRLSTELRNRMTHVMDPSTRIKHRAVVRYYRKLPIEREDFAKYGKQSGVDPRILWPTREELSETVALEKQFEPTLQQMWTNIAKRKKEEEMARRKKQELIAKQMAKMPQMIEQYRQKLRKKELAHAEQEKKKEALLEEARDYYGYPISLYDPRIEELKARKEEEEKKIAKAKKKEEKQARWLATLRGDGGKSQTATIQSGEQSAGANAPAAGSGDVSKTASDGTSDNKNTNIKKKNVKTKKATGESTTSATTPPVSVDAVVAPPVAAASVKDKLNTTK